jgi:hypothetical protein
MRLLEAARKERDKIQARAEKRANEYAAAARVVSELTENNGKGHKKARFQNEDDEDEDGVEQFEAPARGGNAPRKGKGNLAMAGGLRALLFLSLCLSLISPSFGFMVPLDKNVSVPFVSGFGSMSHVSFGSTNGLMFPSDPVSGDLFRPYFAQDPVLYVNNVSSLSLDPWDSTGWRSTPTSTRDPVLYEPSPVPDYPLSTAYDTSSPFYTATFVCAQPISTDVSVGFLDMHTLSRVRDATVQLTVPAHVSRDVPVSNLSFAASWARSPLNASFHVPRSAPMSRFYSHSLSMSTVPGGLLSFDRDLHYAGMSLFFFVHLRMSLLSILCQIFIIFSIYLWGLILLRYLVLKRPLSVLKPLCQLLLCGMKCGRFVSKC